MVGRQNCKIHFVGIGGIGMSGLAVLASSRRYVVSGCDSEVIDFNVQAMLQSVGISIVRGHGVSHINDIDLLVYTSAVPKDHLELVAARAAGIPVLRRAEFLASLMESARCRVAIAGSHGKTSTTALISWILTYAGYDPTSVIGGIAQNISSNVRIGREDFFVAEADESDRSFLCYRPSIAVVTNIDSDHLETYGNIDGVREAFVQFLGCLSDDGVSVVCSDDAQVRSVMPDIDTRILTYGVDSSFSPTVLGKNLQLEVGSSLFEVVVDEATLGSVRLPMSGRHNIQNALAAIAVARECGVGFDAICKAISEFKGVQRRLEFKGTYRGACIFDDYGHHPTEITHTIAAVKKRAAGRVFVVFQPHRYTRTEQLWNQFVEILASTGVDRMYVVDIYSAGERPNATICSNDLVNEINKRCVTIGRVEYVRSFEGAVEKLLRELSEGDLLLTLGAGDVYRVGEMIVQSA